MKIFRSRSSIRKRLKLYGGVIGISIVATVLVLLISGIGQAASTKYIRSDATGGDCAAIGTWDAATLTCTLNTDLSFTATNGLEISNNNITIDGNGHTLTGSGSSGIYIRGRSGVTVKRLNIVGFNNGVYIMNASSSIIVEDNNIANSNYGINVAYSSSNTFRGNTISNSGTYGLYLNNSTTNVVYRNNFIANATQARIANDGANVFDLPLPTGGNYWSNWTGPDANGDGIVDSPYNFSSGSDNLPFANQNGWMDTLPPSVSNIQPSGTIYSSSASVSAYFIDLGTPASGIDTSSVAVTLDGSALGGCNVTSSGVNCPVSGLAYGYHTIGGSVSDNAGNTSPISGGFDVGDVTAPVVNYEGPNGLISSQPSGINASYSDADPSSGINALSATATLNGGAPISCTAAAGSISCPAGSIADGHYEVQVSISDNASNSGYGAGSFDLDSTGPDVSDIQPSGAIISSAAISAYFTDPGTGVDVSSVTLTLDGSPLAGCSITSNSISCPVATLSVGFHTIGGSVSDNAGNTSAINGDFEVILQAITGGPSPHGGYGAGTDFCNSCHDVHDSAGDYALMREATVTETCATCHGLFGNAPDGIWTVAPPDLGGSSTANATASVYSAYVFTGSSKLSGHDLGVSLNGEPSRNDDDVPGGSIDLRVIRSEDYEEGDRYDHEATTAFDATAGLYCASCHTPHGMLTGNDLTGRLIIDGECTVVPGPDGVPDTPKNRSEGNFGRQLVSEQCASYPRDVTPDKLLSNRPNHSSVSVDAADAIGGYNAFCISCHDEQDDGEDPVNDSIHNHPPLCVFCHTSTATDFPHTRDQVALMSSGSDASCTGCHGQAIIDPVTGETLGPLP